MVCHGAWVQEREKRPHCCSQYEENEELQLSQMLKKQLLLEALFEAQ